MARLRTPDDHPFIESAFSTAKCAPEHPSCFRDDREAGACFEKYFDWYNHRHYRSCIDYVTPAQAHQVLREAIVRRRRSNNRPDASSAGWKTRKSVHPSRKTTDHQASFL